MRDITDRSLRLLQNEFIAMASHELRTPMTAISGYLQLASRQVQTGGDPERIKRHLSGAINQVKRQVRLIDELLDASRLETGKLHLEVQPVELNAMLASIANVAQVLAEDKAIVIDIGEEPVMVHADAARLEQVVLNLVINALTHAPESAHIDMRLRSDDGEAVIEIQDHGEGIPAADLATIFERFAQHEGLDRDTANAGLAWGCSSLRKSSRPTAAASRFGLQTVRGQHSPSACHAWSARIRRRLQSLRMRDEGKPPADLCFHPKHVARNPDGQAVFHAPGNVGADP